MSSFSFPPSQRRSLLRDLADGLLQQMFLWGCDVRQPGGSLLVEFGMERLARAEVASEGSSRYRAPWEGGVIELHGFCAGWYPGRHKGKGVVFVRHQGRLNFCDGGEPVTPGIYAGIGGGGADTLLEASLPFVRWLVRYESWIERNTATGYRTACWKDYLSLMGARPWLPPRQALEWLRQLAESPKTASRARRKLRNRPVERPWSATSHRFLS